MIKHSFSYLETWLEVGYANSPYLNHKDPSRWLNGVKYGEIRPMSRAYNPSYGHL